MVEFRVRIADNIMKKFYLGRYAQDVPLGISKYENLKHILTNEEILDAIVMSASGINQAPISIAFEVNDAIKIVNYISNLIGISGLELVNAISDQQHDEQIRKMITEAERQKDYEYVGDGDDWAEELISWAEQNDLPSLKPFDSPAYRQTGFPRSKSELMGLEFLHLPSCNISELPASIGKLKNIQAICLDENQISEIPQEICSISSLVRLDLDDNQISTLPKEIGQLQNLQTLSLRNNPILDFPIEMTGLRNLRKLDIKGVKIHLSSKYSPLSANGFEVYNYFDSNGVIKEDNLSYWLENTDTSNLEVTG
nr:leucine-rich repeat domain-containing protein [Endozoicomonas sp. YOMI1]